MGHSVYTYQSGVIAFGMCGAGGRVSRRIAGQRSRAHGQTGGKTLVTQRAKVGFFPCCSSVTHVAAPGSYSIGAQFVYKDVVMGLGALAVFRPSDMSRRRAISRKTGIGRLRPSTFVSTLAELGSFVLGWYL